jgi:hypothetical protein
VMIEKRILPGSTGVERCGTTIKKDPYPARLKACPSGG